MIELGRQHRTAWDLYKAFEQQANGGKKLARRRAARLVRRLHARRRDLQFRSRPGQESFADREAHAGVREAPARQARPDRSATSSSTRFSNCAPPGHPRWLTEPFLREFVPTPDQTWLINEMVNDIRRIYTDGRGHVPEADRYPLYNGDSIGFWDGQRLVIHTNQLTSGQYQRTQPEYTRASRDGRDLGEGRRPQHRRARLGLRSAGARRAVVREADLHEAQRTKTEPCAFATGTAARIRTTR